jgi:hypothetical protein
MIELLSFNHGTVYFKHVLKLIILCDDRKPTWISLHLLPISGLSSTILKVTIVYVDLNSKMFGQRHVYTRIEHWKLGWVDVHYDNLFFFHIQAQWTKSLSWTSWNKWTSQHLNPDQVNVIVECNFGIKLALTSCCDLFQVWKSTWVIKKLKLQAKPP